MLRLEHAISPRYYVRKKLPIRVEQKRNGEGTPNLHQKKLLFDTRRSESLAFGLRKEEMTDSIKELTETIDQLIYSPRNQRIIKAWKKQDYTAKDHWRGIPLPSAKSGMIPFTVEPELPMWAQILEFDVQEFYSNPKYYLENTLRMIIYRFENFQDFICVEKTIPIWLGVSLD